MKNLSTEFGDRLVQLHNGAQGVRAEIKVTAKAVEGTKPIVEFVSSDATVDRYNEVIDPEGWELADYQNNPVFQDSHCYDTIARTLGRANITDVRMMQGRSALFQQIEFATEANPLAKMAYQMYKGGFLHAVSVGFVPVKWQNGNSDPNGPQYSRKYTKQSLLETSAVSIPANPNALALAYKAGAVEKSDMKELGQMLRHFGTALELKDIKEKFKAGDLVTIDETVKAARLEEYPYNQIKGQVGKVISVYPEFAAMDVEYLTPKFTGMIRGTVFEFFRNAETEKACPDCAGKLIHNLEAKVLTCKQCGYQEEATAEGESNAGNRLSILQDSQLLKLFRETAALCRRA